MSAGGGGVFDVRIDHPGLYPVVSHSFASVNMGQVGLLRVGDVHGSMSPKTGDAGVRDPSYLAGGQNVQSSVDRVKAKLPLVLSATALVVALFGATPLGNAAYNMVSFAKNAGKVNGIKASRAPKANQLLPLGPTRKFPSSVVPQGPPGPQGPAGPAGPAASNLFAVVNADGSIYKQKGVNGLNKVDTGVYDITFNRSIDDCAVTASVGGHRTGPTTWNDAPEGVATLRTFGQVVEVIILGNNGAYGLTVHRDFGFHVAAFC